MREMMTEDCQSGELAGWLQSLGWQGDLRPTNLQKLNTPKMHSIWRHLQAHVVPTHLATIIRKNVLLHRLEEENIFFDQFLNFQLDSVNQLSKVEGIMKIKEEKDNVLEEIKMIDVKLKHESHSFMQKNSIIEWESRKLTETENKTTILELKKAKLLKDCKKVNAEIDTVAHLKSSKIPVSHKDLNYQKSSVCKYVKNYRYPMKDTDDDSEYLCDMISSVLEFKPGTILDGIVHIAKEALHTLNLRVGIGNDKFSSSKTLRDLKIRIIRKELQIRQCDEKLNLESEGLSKEKAELVKVLAKSTNLGNQSEEEKNLGSIEHEKRKSGLSEALSGNDECDDSFGKFDESESRDRNLKNNCNEESEVCKGDSKKQTRQVLDDFLENIQKVRKHEKMLKEVNRLTYNNEFEHSITDLTAKEDELWREVEKKVDEINLVLSILLSGEVNSGKLNELFPEILHLTKIFKSECSRMCNTVDSIKLTDLILKEIEVFQATPMIALQRKWNKSNHVLQDYSTKKYSNDTTLINFLLQREEKNSIVNILEKYLWTLNMNSLLH